MCKTCKIRFSNNSFNEIAFVFCKTVEINEKINKRDSFSKLLVMIERAKMKICKIKLMKIFTIFLCYQFT